MPFTKSAIEQINNIANKKLDNYKNSSAVIFSTWINTQAKNVMPTYQQKIDKLQKEVDKYNEYYEKMEDFNKITVETEKEENGRKTFVRETLDDDQVIERRDGFKKQIDDKVDLARQEYTGTYIAARKKVDSRPLFSKIFFFIRTIREALALNAMEKTLHNLGIQQTELNSLAKVTEDDQLLKNCEGIDENGKIFVDSPLLKSDSLVSDEPYLSNEPDEDLVPVSEDILSSAYRDPNIQYMMRKDGIIIMRKKDIANDDNEEKLDDEELDENEFRKDLGNDVNDSLVGDKGSNSEKTESIKYESEKSVPQSEKLDM